MKLTSELLASLEGKTLITDSGCWSSNGEWSRDHYKVDAGKPVYVGKQPYWTNQAGTFDDSDSGWSSSFVIKGEDTLCIGSERNVIINMPS